MTRIRLMVALALAAVGTACATAAAPRAAPERLYFALELRTEGHLVGRPKLLGETGKALRVEKHSSAGSLLDYRLLLLPQSDGDRFHLVLDVEVPGAPAAHQEFALLHGETRRLHLGRVPGELEAELLLMRVDSPEFRALMEVGARGEAGADVL